MTPEFAQILTEVLAAAHRVDAFMKQKTERKFRGDAVLRAAVQMQFVVIGEAIKRLGKEDRGLVSRIQGYDTMINFSDSLAAAPDQVSVDHQWNMIDKRVPMLIKDVSSLLGLALPETVVPPFEKDADDRYETRRPDTRPRAESSRSTAKSGGHSSEADAEEGEDEPTANGDDAAGALRTFRASMKISYDDWKEGVGYDLDAFDKLSKADKGKIVREFIANDSLNWRDMEILARDASAASFDRLRDSMTSHHPVDERAHALRYVIEMGKASGSVPDAQLSHMVDAMGGDDPTATILDLIENHAGPRTIAAMLRGVRDRPGVGYHFASNLFVIAGLSTDEWDWKHRPLWLRLGKDNTDEERTKAFVEFCQMLKIDPSDIPDEASGKGYTLKPAKGAVTPDKKKS